MVIFTVTSILLMVSYLFILLLNYLEIKGKYMNKRKVGNTTYYYYQVYQPELWRRPYEINIYTRTLGISTKEISVETQDINIAHKELLERIKNKDSFITKFKD